jgi:protein gp37
MQRTGIEYLTHTWNPIAMRCTPISEGCANCWHLAVCKRHAVNPKLPDDVRKAKAGGPPVVLTHELETPSRLRKPARIGVQFMGDLFHPDVPGLTINDVWLWAFSHPRHTFVFLTKRPRRLANWTRMAAASKGWPENEIWPDWMWVGVTAENQQQADERISILLKIPAAVRFVSVEPMLGPIDMGRATGCNGWDGGGDFPHQRGCCVDWVICGAETGPAARSMTPTWAAALHDQCKVAGVPLFFKRDSDGRRTIHGELHEEYP